MENSQNNIGYFPQMQICDKHSTVELNSDFTLPDYQPEIRRLLSTKAIILPQNQYIGNGNAEINGEICYKVTYLGADGALYCTTLLDKYGLTASLDFNSHSVNSDEITVIPHFKTESINARVLGPRKLNLRTRLDCKVLCYSPSLYSPNLVGPHNKSTIENRIFQTNSINIKHSARENITLNDFVAFDTPSESLRIIDCSSNVVFNECTPSVDRINVKGDVVLKILYCNDAESSHPLWINKKIPFACILNCTGVNSLFECVAQGVCFDEKFDFSDNGISLELTLSLFALAQRNENVKYVADAYSTEKVCENTTNELTVINAVRACFGNLTQNDVFSLENVKLSPDSKIIDISGKCTVNEVTGENGKLVFKGNNDYQLIYSLDGEYSSLSLSAPLRYELDSKSFNAAEKEVKWLICENISSLRARHDGERLFVDSEINLCIVLDCENKIEILDEMVFGEYLKKANSEILLCYPEKSATVWSVAKQYGEPQKALRAKNSIPETEDQIKKRYLVI